MSDFSQNNGTTARTNEPSVPAKMKIKITYPEAKRPLAFLRVQYIVKWCMLMAAAVCGVINIATGGKAWSLVVIWGMWCAWTQLLSPDMVEYNRISQTIKFVFNACIMLGLIDITLAPGWAAPVITIVCFAALIIVTVLFVTDFITQRQNMFPMILFSAACLIGSIVGIAADWHFTPPVFYAVTGLYSLCLMLFCAGRLGKDFFTELRKRFSLK